MPFLREIIPSHGIRAGIWHITETATELLSSLQLSDSEINTYNSFSHDLRKRQWLAYRALLCHMLQPESPEVAYDVAGKPYLISGSHNISVTHAGDFAAAVTSENRLVGIDIERLRDRVERVKQRFMHDSEIESLVGEKRLEHLYIHWCGKEALYKLNGKPELDFKKGIFIHPFDYLCNTNQRCSATLTVNGFRNDFTLYFQKIEDYMMAVAY